MCHTNERMARRVARVSYLERGWGKGSRVCLRTLQVMAAGGLSN
jgi:3-dehydroquinate synthase class II